MRIAIVNQHLSDAVGGSELQCDLVGRGLAARGHEVVYVAVDAAGGASGSRDRSDTGPGYRLLRVAPSPEAIVTACLAVQTDVVYWRLNRGRLRPVVERLRHHGVPLVFATAHVDDVVRWPARPWPRSSLRGQASELRARVEERAAWGSFRHVAGIASQREDFLGRVPVARQRLVRNLMSEAFEPFVHPRPYIAWVGSLQRRKRPENLPEVARQVLPLGVDVLVAGELRDPGFRGLFGPRSPNLHHLGVVPLGRTIGLLAGARMLLVTAHEEGFANVLIQAWWHGTPTVSLEHDPDGLIARHGLGDSCRGDPRRMLDSVVGLLGASGGDETARRERISLFARTEFATERNLNALESLLHESMAFR